MARPKTSIDRLASLRKTFQSNVGKVLSAKEVQNVIGATYWRACIKDLKTEGLKIESVRKGRTVVGYKFVGGKNRSTNKVVKEVAAAAFVAASKPKTVVKKPKANKSAPPKKMTAVEQKTAAKKNSVAIQATNLGPTEKVKGQKVVAEVVDETPAGEEDPDVIAILRQAGL